MSAPVVRWPGSCSGPADLPSAVLIEDRAVAQEYTCPMHPEIVRDGPGSCPICGMALEPRTASLEEAPNPELADMTRRFRVSLALTVPLLFAAMAPMAGLRLGALEGSPGRWV